MNLVSIKELYYDARPTKSQDTLPLFGATHYSPTIAVCKFCSPNDSALLATTPGAPPSHVFIPP